MKKEEPRSVPVRPKVCTRHVHEPLRFSKTNHAIPWGLVGVKKEEPRDSTEAPCGIFGEGASDAVFRGTEPLRDAPPLSNDPSRP